MNNFQNYGLKIGFPPGSPVKYKLMKFVDVNTISVKEAINVITSKHNLATPEQYVLQVTYLNEKNEKKFKWTEDTSKLSSYPLSANDVILELKKKYQLIKVFDGKKLSTILVDITRPLSELIQYISCKLKLKSSIINYQLFNSLVELNLQYSIKQLNVDTSIPFILKEKNDITYSLEEMNKYLLALDDDSMNENEIMNLNQLSLNVPAKSIMNVLKEGYIKKQNRKKSWNSRYFYLTDKYLYYYKTPHSTIASGIISYREHVIKLVGPSKDAKIELIPKSKFLTSASTHTHPGAYIIKFDTESEMNSWLIPPFSLDSTTATNSSSISNSSSTSGNLSTSNKDQSSVTSGGSNATGGASGGNNSRFKGRSGTVPAAVFAIPLDKVLCTPDGMPIILKQTIEYIENKAMDQTGIFRLSGSVVTIDAWRSKYDRGEKVDLSTETDPHAIAGLLKLFLRELPDPILTYDKYNNFIAAQCVEDFPNRIKVIKSLIKSLPAVNQLVLNTLMSFLGRVAQHAQNNKMQIHNLSTVFGPNLIKEKQKENFSDNVQSLVEDTPIINALTLSLIRDYAYIFQEKEIPEQKIFARTLYEFQGDNNNEDENDRDLLFPKGVTIRVIHQGTDGWWTGEYQGKSGKYPATYVELISSTQSPATLMRTKSNTNLSKKKKFMLEMDNTRSKVHDLENNTFQLQENKKKLEKQIEVLKAEREQLLLDESIQMIIGTIKTSKSNKDIAIIPKNITLLFTKYNEYKKSHDDLQPIKQTLQEEFDQFMNNPKKKTLDTKDKDQLNLKIENISSNIDKYQTIRQKSINSKRIINEDLKEVQQFFNL